MSTRTPTTGTAPAARNRARRTTATAAAAAASALLVAALWTARREHAGRTGAGAPAPPAASLAMTDPAMALTDTGHADMDQSHGARPDAADTGMPGMDMARPDMTRPNAAAGRAAGTPAGPGASVRLTPEQIRQFGITFATVERRMLAGPVRAAGAVEYDETRVARIAARVGGFVERLYVGVTGQSVRRGEPLLELYSPDLLAAQEELLVAAQLERELGEGAPPGESGRGAGLLEAARRRLRLWGITDAQIDEVLRAGRARRTLALHAPVSGVVVEKNVLAGQAVEAGQTLYTLADLSRVWVQAEVREHDAGLVRPGAPAVLELVADPGRTIAGRVEFVRPVLDPGARTLAARIAVPNPDGRLRPGMYATVRIEAPLRAALAIPTSALLRTGTRTIAFVDMGDGTLMPHELRIGRVAGEYAEVLSGVEPGQRVATSAHFLLDSESNLAEVMRAMLSQMNTSDMGRTSPGKTGASPMPGMDMPGMDTAGMETPGIDTAGRGTTGREPSGQRPRGAAGAAPGRPGRGNPQREPGRR